MSLSAKNRSAIYAGLSTVIPEPEAVEEMLSNFAARHDEEWASREFIRAEAAELRGDLEAQMAALRSDLEAQMAALRSDLEAQMAALRSEVHTEISTVRVGTCQVGVAGGG